MDEMFIRSITILISFIREARGPPTGEIAFPVIVGTVNSGSIWRHSTPFLTIFEQNHGESYGQIFIPPAKRKFSGVYWNQHVCPWVRPCVPVSVCMQNTVVSVKALAEVLSRIRRQL